MTVKIETKDAVTVAEMARMVRLSRARFYQLIDAGVFPYPVYCISTRRPMYDETAQQVCLEVRRRNCGINGKPILFYAARTNARVAVRNKIKSLPNSTPKDQRIVAILDGLNGLGMTTATAAHVQQVTEQLFPNGTAGIDQAEVLRDVFLRLRQDSGR